MKYLSLIIFLFLAACGSGNEDSPSIDYKQACNPESYLVGGWEDSNLDDLVFGSDCFGQTTDSCDLRFNYYKPVNNQILINVNSSEPGCLSEGEHICSITQGDTPEKFIEVNCTGSSTIYFRK